MPANGAGGRALTENVRIGVDVGGTNTDAVLLQGRTVLASHKAPTSPDVGTGIVEAIKDVLLQGAVPASAVAGVMIGTTHFTNAFVEGKNLSRVGIVRLAAPATLSVRPLADWPAHLLETIGDQAVIVGGGYNYDG